MEATKLGITWRFALGTVFFSGGTIALFILLLEHLLHYELNYLVSMSSLIAIVGITLLLWPSLKNTFTKKPNTRA